MKTDFALLLHKYFRDYLINNLGASNCTISTYRMAFVQFIDYMESVQHLAAELIDLNHITRQNILSFLEWLEQKRSVSVATRNQRLAAFKSFAVYIRYERPEYLAQTDDVRKIKIKKSQQKEMSYLKPEGINLLLGQIDRTILSGQRDYTMFFLMYTTGIRVSELINIKGRDVSMSHPRHLLIHGKLSDHRKREAIEGASLQIVNPEEPLWETNTSLKKWLMNLGKNKIM